jgi:CubicO group peptidase (beta-lactamase class C family)
MLCSAIAHAEANGTTRTPQSVEQWELTGIQSPLDGIVRTLGYEIVRHDNGTLERVTVGWDASAEPRAAIHLDGDNGCALNPLGGPSAFYGRPANPAGGRRVDPVAVRNAPAALVPVFTAAIGNGYGEATRTTAVVVQRGGTIIGEQYADSFGPVTPQRTWSVAKSIAATLVGAAVLAGETSVDEPVGINYWRAGGASDPRNTVTLDHALRMTTGRYSDTPGNRTDALYFGGSTVDETALDWPLIHKPGTVFRYANNDTLLAVKAIGQWLSFYPPNEFFAKLGMTHTVAETDWKGDYVLSSQVWSTAGDLANLGQLYLDDGVLPSGERVLPEGWVKYVSTPSGPQPPTGTFGYGAGFWLLNKEEGVPADTFAAIGNRGQYVVIVPSRNVVIVRRGEDPVGSGFDIAAFTRDVLAVLPKE